MCRSLTHASLKVASFLSHNGSRGRHDVKFGPGRTLGLADDANASAGRSSGVIRSCGPTLRKLIGHALRADTAFDLRRAPPDSTLMAALHQAAKTGRRIFLGLRGSDLPRFAAKRQRFPGEDVLLNLGFGIGVIEAIAAYDLTDADCCK